MTGPDAGSCALPLSVAAEELTGFEVLAIQKAMGKAMEAFNGTELLLAVVWAFRSRTGETSWADVKSMTVRALGAYFAPEPKPAGDGDESEPETETGK